MFCREGNAGWHRRQATANLLSVLLLTVPLCSPLNADEIPVLHKEGLLHGFLVLRDLGGRKLADGEIAQEVKDDHVRSRLVFRFQDGSLYDDTAEFTQQKSFRLVRDHLVTKGPAFRKPSDTLIDVSKGEVTVRSKDDHGQEKVSTHKMELPPDIANGLVNTLVKDFPPAAPQVTISLLAGTDKPLIVKLRISSAGERAVTNGKISVRATIYDVKVQIEGIRGTLAKVTGKQPPDTHIWVLQGETPAFVQSEGPLAEGGPVWRIELTSPKVSR